MYSTNIHSLIVRECRSKFEGEPPVLTELLCESWVPIFLKLFLGDDGEGLDAVAVALCEEG